MGRALNNVPDDTLLLDHLKIGDRYELIEQVTRDFWKRWSAEVTPLKIIRQKWHQSQRNLCPGDLVLVHDETAIKGAYKLAIVKSVKVSSDGLVRSCEVEYKIPNSKDSCKEYTGGKTIVLKRSVQRLSLLIPIEEQSQKLVVEDKHVKIDD